MSEESLAKSMTIIRDFSIICRTCLGDSNVHSINGMTIDGANVTDLLDYTVQIKIEHPDRLPQNLCMSCIKELQRSYKFKCQCVSNEAALKLLVQEAEKLAEDKDNVIEVDSDDDRSSVKELIACDVSINEDSATTDDDCDNDNDERKEGDKINPVITAGIISCVECLETFETKELLIEHRKETKHRPALKYPCEVCNKPIPTNQMKQHMRIHTKERPHQCEVCPMSFSSLGNLKRHVLKHTGERPHICGVCGKGFIQHCSLVKHEKTHHSDVPLLKKVTERFTCDVCGKCFKMASAFNAHLDQHTNDEELVPLDSDKERSYVCGICSKSFESKSLLNSHQVLNHKEENYLCSHCGRRFYTKVGLQSHSRVHGGEKSFTCVICKKVFSEISSFDAHMEVHSGYEPFSCKYCPRTFTQPNDLIQHSRTHTGEKPLTCTYCEKTFVQRGNLKVHMRTHTGETHPYLCIICGRHFRDLNSMKEHKRNHEQDKDNSDSLIKKAGISSNKKMRLLKKLHSE